MDLLFTDFNGADAYYGGPGAPEWSEIESIIRRMPLFVQGSQQKGKTGRAIFDPKATNEFLNAEAAALGWRAIPVPRELTEFGKDWDAGKGATLAEWQFSNYPFLWNNIIRSEAVFKSGMRLPGLEVIKGLVVVTKSGRFPSSNSTLYFEQALAQISGLAKIGSLSIPIRLVGLTLLDGTESAEVIWSEYPGRYSRSALRRGNQKMQVVWKKKGKHGVTRIVLTRA